MEKLFSSILSFMICADTFGQYIPMDYSTCGYKASETNIPQGKNVVFTQNTSGDCYSRLQKAINYMEILKADKNGLRGTILLGEGVYNISEPLRITSSGIIIRGIDKKKTIIRKTGVDRGAVIYIEGKEDLSYNDTIEIAKDAAPGNLTLALTSAAKLHKGDRITILRPSTKEWIASLGCQIFGGGIDYTGWKPTDIDINWCRTVTAVDGNEITFDAPITSSIDKKYGGGKVLLGYNKGEINNCGIENLTLISDYHNYNAKDEDHCWDGIWMDNARDCWVRRVNFIHFAGSAVNLQKNTSRMTIEDCIASEPISEIGGWRRCTFLTRGQQTLIQRCISRHGIHDFAAGYCAAGPNAFVQCEAEESLGFSGSIGSWATGLLFDIVNVDGNDIKFKNLEQFQFGTGWNTANSMMWQCTASQLDCYSPDQKNKNSANGCWGTFQGNGEWSESNNHINPRSLFYTQLSKRMGGKSINGYILPRATDASSSPAIDEAQKLANEALTIPRLTMEMWLDSIPYSPSSSTKNAIDADHIKLKETAKELEKKPTFTVYNGRLTVDGTLITGNGYSIPWWAGRVKDNFLPQSKPAITRFVPGREGTGWTDRIDSVVKFMKEKHFAMLDHHYGLWYDLRRTDHERIRRSDGDVWAPFYEQAFARSGQGTAWDGLSRYDLTKPNLWYWNRLKEYAMKGGKQGLLLFNQNYFQHNILEAGAHWVDCPWRTVNNINKTDFPEPVPFTGDKRIFMAEYFYNEKDTILRHLHQQYIWQNLENFKDEQNVIQLISEEYTGPLHFTRFWLQTIAEWEKKTGRHPLIALSCTKDTQDSILADPNLNKVVDIIDIRYWHYKTDGIYAPEAGKNLAPRQFMRKMKVGKTGFMEAYKAVEEYRNKYPDKAVTFYAQQYPDYGWAILMAGGSIPNVKVDNRQFLSDITMMKTIDTKNNNYQMMGNSDNGYVIYSHTRQQIHLEIARGKYILWLINPRTGMMKQSADMEKLIKSGSFTTDDGEMAYWFQKQGESN